MTDVIENAQIEAKKEAMNKVLAELSPREERILRMRYGIGVPMAYTLEEAGNCFNVTRERIRQIEAKALRKLLAPERLKKIQDAGYDSFFDFAQDIRAMQKAEAEAQK